MAEWLNAAVSKTVGHFCGSGVRISLFPLVEFTRVAIKIYKLLHFNVCPTSKFNMGLKFAKVFSKKAFFWIIFMNRNRKKNKKFKTFII